MDVDLAQSFDKRVVRQTGEPQFSDLAATRQSIRDELVVGLQTLPQIGNVAFAWLHEIAMRRRVGA